MRHGEEKRGKKSTQLHGGCPSVCFYTPAAPARSERKQKQKTKKHTQNHIQHGRRGFILKEKKKNVEKGRASQTVSFVKHKAQLLGEGEKKKKIQPEVNNTKRSFSLSHSFHTAYLYAYVCMCLLGYQCNCRRRAPSLKIKSITRITIIKVIVIEVKENSIIYIVIIVVIIAKKKKKKKSLL